MHPFLLPEKFGLFQLSGLDSRFKINSWFVAMPLAVKNNQEVPSQTDEKISVQTVSYAEIHPQL